MLIDCSAPTPKGQVVAIVNGQEVTVQDIKSEASAEGPKRSSDPKVLLHRVIARVLFAQEARKMGLDHYTGYPADVNRINQTLLAQKAVSNLVKAPAPPTEAEIQSFIDQNPNLFKNRMLISVDEISFDSSIDMNLLQSETTLPGIAARLKSLDAPFQQQSLTLDYADLPPQLIERLKAEPLGKMFYIRAPGRVQALVITQTTPVQTPALEQKKFALNILSERSAQKASEAVLQQLEAKAHIAYQPTFAPSAKPAPGAQAPAQPAKG